MAAAIDASASVPTASATAAQADCSAAIRSGIGKVQGAGYNEHSSAESC